MTKLVAMFKFNSAPFLAVFFIQLASGFTAQAAIFPLGQKSKACELLLSGSTSESSIVRFSFDFEGVSPELRQAMQLLNARPQDVLNQDIEFILIVHSTDTDKNVKTRVSQVLSAPSNEIPLDWGSSNSLLRSSVSLVTELTLDIKMNELKEARAPESVEIALVVRSSPALAQEVNLERLSTQAHSALSSVLRSSNFSFHTFLVEGSSREVLAHTPASYSEDVSSSDLSKYKALLRARNRILKRDFFRLDPGMALAMFDNLEDVPKGAVVFVSGAGDGTLHDATIDWLKENRRTDLSVVSTSLVSKDVAVQNRPGLFAGRMLEHLDPGEISALRGKVGFGFEQWGDIFNTVEIAKSLENLHEILVPGGKFYLVMGPEVWRYRSGFGKIKEKGSLHADQFNIGGETVGFVEFMQRWVKGFRVTINADENYLILEKTPESFNISAAVGFVEYLSLSHTRNRLFVAPGNP